MIRNVIKMAVRQPESDQIPVVLCVTSVEDRIDGVVKARQTARPALAVSSAMTKQFVAAIPPVFIRICIAFFPLCVDGFVPIMFDL